MPECTPCGPGTSSEEKAWRCTDCLPGSYATGGEPECLPCEPGSATDKEGQSECTFCFPGWYAGVGFTECRKCGLFDQQQLTDGVPKGVVCTGGVINGTKPGFWAASTVDEATGNWTRVWKCSIKGVCLGGVDSGCLEGYTGPLCDSCAEGYFGNKKKECFACPAGAVDLGVANRVQWALTLMAAAFVAGCVLVLLLFKSRMFDQAINFWYRVRTNPILAITQLWTKRHLRLAQKRKKAQAQAAQAAQAAKEEAQQHQATGQCTSPFKDATGAKKLKLSAAAETSSILVATSEPASLAPVSPVPPQRETVREDSSATCSSSSYSGELASPATRRERGGATPAALRERRIGQVGERVSSTALVARLQPVSLGSSAAPSSAAVSAAPSSAAVSATATASNRAAVLNRAVAHLERQRSQPVSMGSSSDALKRARAAKSERDAASPVSPESSEGLCEEAKQEGRKCEELISRKLHAANQAYIRSRSLNSAVAFGLPSITRADDSSPTAPSASTGRFALRGPMQDSSPATSSPSAGRIALRAHSCSIGPRHVQSGPERQMRRQRSTVPRNASTGQRLDQIPWKSVSQHRPRGGAESMHTGSPVDALLRARDGPEAGGSPGDWAIMRARTMGAVPSGMPPVLLSEQDSPTVASGRRRRTQLSPDMCAPPSLQEPSDDAVHSPPPSPPALGNDKDSAGAAAPPERRMLPRSSTRKLRSTRKLPVEDAIKTAEELAQLEFDLKGKGVIRVHLKSGRELAAEIDSTHDGRADTSFPYVTMHMMGKEHHRSKMRKRTLNPKWDETFEFRGAHEQGGRPSLQSLLNRGLFLEVYNEATVMGLDALAHNKWLGNATVDLQTLTRKSKSSFSVPLSTKGNLSLTVSWEVEEPFSPLEHELKKVGVIRVLLHGATALKDADQDADSGAHMKLSLGGEVCRSQTIQNSVNPEWEESLEFFGNDKQDLEAARQTVEELLGQNLELECFREDKGQFGTTNHEIGTATVDLKQLFTKHEAQLSVPLSKRGAVSLTVSWEVEEMGEAEEEHGGDYKLGDQVTFAGADETLENGNKFTDGQQGEVVGEVVDDGEDEPYIEVLFPGNTGSVRVTLDQVRRVRKASPSIENVSSVETLDATQEELQEAAIIIIKEQLQELGFHAREVEEHRVAVALEENSGHMGRSLVQLKAAFAEARGAPTDGKAEQLVAPPEAVVNVLAILRRDGLDATAERIAFYLEANQMHIGRSAAALMRSLEHQGGMQKYARPPSFVKRELVKIGAKLKQKASEMKQPDMASLSVSITIVVKFVLFELSGFLQARRAPFPAGSLPSQSSMHPVLGR